MPSTLRGMLVLGLTVVFTRLKLLGSVLMGFSYCVNMTPDVAARIIGGALALYALSALY